MNKKRKREIGIVKEPTNENKKKPIRKETNDW